MKIGIFFGGQSREREVSFAGGRTVYDNLDKNLFEPVPIFVDSLGNFIELDWQYIYKGTIRDFYPPAQFIPASTSKIQLYIESLGNLSAEKLEEIISQVGKKIEPNQFKDLFDFAFLALHGQYGEDGNIQGILEWYNVPYSGSGILPSSIGINKIIQNNILKNADFYRPEQVVIQKDEIVLFEDIEKKLGLPFVIKSPHQGSSIGVSIIKNKNQFQKALEKSFFIENIDIIDWKNKNTQEKQQFLLKFTDIREGVGFPVFTQYQQIIYHPEQLLSLLNESNENIILTAKNSEEFVLFEEFIEGKEFSCIVIQDESGKTLALPPTEIRKYNDVFDYRSKYLPGTSRKITPIETTDEIIIEIREQCCRLFEVLNCNVYARIDGFIRKKDNAIFLNDPNTTSGMMPSSFFFHQAAEIGLNSKDFLTYIIRTSLSERIKAGKNNVFLRQILLQLDQKIKDNKTQATQKIPVGVLMGGYSTERHISMESGRNVYEKLASSTKYAPFPIFLTGDEKEQLMYILPLNYMLKDNADDIKDKINHQKNALIMENIIKEFENITQKYVGFVLTKPEKISYQTLAEKTKLVFIALHGRPGEDGAVQKEFEKLGIAYNGSGVESSKLTINKYETNEILRKNNILVANHTLIFEKDWIENKENVLQNIITNFQFPLIAKPADDGCSSAVKKIKNTEQLIAFAEMMFRPFPDFLENSVKILDLKQNEEFPQKNYFLVEELIEKKEANYFLEITGGMLTHFNENNNEIEYEVFEPSEALATGDILSLEEKFLAGEGQNITPAIYVDKQNLNQEVAKKVKEELKKTAQLLNVKGYCRIDAFVRVYENPFKVETIIIEINSLPGMTPATCIFHQAAINQYKPYQFIDKILEFGKKNANK
ncbi:MAG: D-alanine--D-alanine ligase [Cytophagales bacterium]|nr:MAG: D-alanine--D-alanine ligase [Cytophagales bacterium]